MRTLPGTQVNHTKMKSGVFVSEKYNLGDAIITVFDLRMKMPYRQDVMETGSVHALEHIVATFLRNDELWGNRILYFGPMGCRTGFYLILAGDYTPEAVLPLVERAFDHAAEFKGEIPFATPKECGYCVDMDLEMAKADAAMYYNVLIDAKKENLYYPVKRVKK
jgi:S-ribosylhomocysteine lyase